MSTEPGDFDALFSMFSCFLMEIMQFHFIHTPEGRHLSGLLLACFHLSVEDVLSKLSNRFCLSSVERDGLPKSDSPCVS